MDLDEAAADQSLKDKLAGLEESKMNIERAEN
jgi:hypothetical protein